MKALILAAGYATRLYPLTKDFPKPLLEVAGRPIIDYIADKLEVLPGITEIIVVTNSKFFAFFKGWAEARSCRIGINVVDDLTLTPDDRRGAIGDLAFILEQQDAVEDFLVIGGDNLFEEGLDDFLRFSLEKIPAPVIGAFDIKDKEKAGKYGVIQLDNEQVVDFQEKPKHPLSTIVGMCVYYFPKATLGLVREYLNQGNKKDALGFYIDWLRKKETVWGFVFSGRWYDIGHPDSYKEADACFRAAGKGTQSEISSKTLKRKKGRSNDGT